MTKSSRRQKEKWIWRGMILPLVGSYFAARQLDMLSVWADWTLLGVTALSLHTQATSAEAVEEITYQGTLPPMS